MIPHERLLANKSTRSQSTPSPAASTSGGAPQGKRPASVEWADDDVLAGELFAYREGALMLGMKAQANGEGAIVGFGGRHRLQDDRHIVTIAGARSGKGLTCIRPNLTRYRGSMLIIDPKGEHAAFELAHGHRAKLGQLVAILDPFGIVGGGQSFNPLEGLETLTPMQLLDQASLICEALVIPEGKDPHWTNGAKNLLRFFILWMAATPKAGAPSLSRLRQLMMGIELPFQDVPSPEGLPLYDSIFKQAEELGEKTGNGELELMGAMFARMGDKEIGFFASTLQNQLGFLAEIAPASERSNFSLSDLKETALTVYLVLPPSKIPSHFRWLRLMLMLAMAAMEKGAVPDWDVVFLLEEFAALGHLEVIEKAAGLMPGYGLKLWVILQDLTQLQSLYRDSWETFLDNAGAIQAFGNDGLTTTKYLSERIGEKEYKIMEDAKLGTQALLGAGATIIERRQRAQLIPPYEIGRAFARESQTRDMLLLRKGAPPAVISRFPYDWRHEPYE